MRLRQEIRRKLKLVSGFTVRYERCTECLFSSKRLVDAHRAASIIRECRERETYFVCHRFSVGGKPGKRYTPTAVCCKAFFDTQNTLPIRMAKLMRIVRFVNEEGDVISKPAMD